MTKPAIRQIVPMPDSQTLRDRAEECRALAESFRHEAPRQKLLKVAADYDRMAMQAAAWELSDLEAAPAVLAPQAPAHAPSRVSPRRQNRPAQLAALAKAPLPARARRSGPEDQADP